MALSVIDHVTDMNIRVRLAEQLLVQIKDGCFENLWIRSPPRVASLTQVLTKWNDCAGVPAKRWACAHFIPPCESHPPSVSGMHTRMKLSDFSGTCSRCWVAKHQKGLSCTATSMCTRANSFYGLGVWGSCVSPIPKLIIQQLSSYSLLSKC